MAKIPIRRVEKRSDLKGLAVGYNRTLDTGRFIDMDDTVSWNDAEGIYYTAEDIFGEQAYFSSVCEWLERNGYEIVIRRKGGH